MWRAPPPLQRAALRCGVLLASPPQRGGGPKGRRGSLSSSFVGRVVQGLPLNSFVGQVVQGLTPPVALGASGSRGYPSVSPFRADSSPLRRGAEVWTSPLHLVARRGGGVASCMLAHTNGQDYRGRVSRPEPMACQKPGSLTHSRPHSRPYSHNKTARAPSPAHAPSPARTITRARDLSFAAPCPTPETATAARAIPASTATRTPGTPGC